VDKNADKKMGRLSPTVPFIRSLPLSGAIGYPDAMNFLAGRDPTQEMLQIKTKMSVL
jgi:hypothetical protein